MQKFDWDKFKNEKIAVHCKTEEEAKDFCRKMHEQGMRWNDGDSYLNEFYWNSYRGEICYTGHGNYSFYSFYEKNNYTILEWSDYMQNEFTKADLRDGMVVEYENKSRRLVINGFLLGKGNHFDLSGYDENLEISYSGLDIMKVFKICKRTTLEEIFDDEKLELIWERTETKRMTAEEMRQKLEEITGKKIEIKPSREEMVGVCYEFCKEQKCSDGCALFEFGSCRFRNYSDEQLKQCYEKVVANGK